MKKKKLKKIIKKMVKKAIEREEAIKKEKEYQSEMDDKILHALSCLADHARRKG